MALGTFIAGRYSSTLAASDLGIAEQGYELIFTPKGELINESDAYGMALIEIVYRGVDSDIMFTSLEYKTGTIAAAWPWGTMGNSGIVGRLGSAIASSLVMTSTAGTPAVATPATLTATRAILSPSTNVNLLFNSKLRRVPIRFNLLPADGSVAITFTQT
jgi:hypothetical protein